MHVIAHAVMLLLSPFQTLSGSSTELLHHGRLLQPRDWKRRWLSLVDAPQEIQEPGQSQVIFFSAFQMSISPRVSLSLILGPY